MLKKFFFSLEFSFLIFLKIHWLGMSMSISQVENELWGLEVTFMSHITIAVKEILIPSAQRVAREAPSTAFLTTA